MGSKTVFFTLESDKTLDEVKSALQKSLSFLGGTLIPAGDGFQLKQGVNGVNFAFAANFDALISIRQPAPNKYEFYGNINWSPNNLFWACLIIGFFVMGILWIIPILYLFIDPTNAYQSAFFQTQNLLK